MFVSEVISRYTGKMSLKVDKVKICYLKAALINSKPLLNGTPTQT